MRGPLLTGYREQADPLRRSIGRRNATPAAAPMLQRLVAGVGGILFSEALAAEGAVVFAKACELGLEGVVSKREGSFLSQRRSRNWLKTKNPNFVQDVTAIPRDALPKKTRPNA
jgi:ATP-dependent DNA ligase